MSSLPVSSRWSGWAPHLQSLLRVVAAVLFLLAGAVKLFAFPAGMPPAGGTAVFPTQIWFAGVLEFFGGLLILLGLCSRTAAFILSGEMAVAYFQVHAHNGNWPVLNGGVPAILYCFIWLYFSAAGPGPWSIEALRRKPHN